MDNLLDKNDLVEATLECLRVEAAGGSYGLMDEEVLIDQIKVQLRRLDFADGQTKHLAYVRIAAAALIMSMRLDHVEKVYSS